VAVSTREVRVCWASDTRLTLVVAVTNLRASCNSSPNVFWKMLYQGNWIFNYTDIFLFIFRVFWVLSCVQVFSNKNLCALLIFSILFVCAMSMPVRPWLVIISAEGRTNVTGNWWLQSFVIVSVYKASLLKRFSGDGSGFQSCEVSCGLWQNGESEIDCDIKVKRELASTSYEVCSVTTAPA
jgi:hypothetical protein